MSQQPKTADLSKSDAEFSIVIEASKDSKIAEATAGFAKTFTLESKVAEQILKSAPIIFLSRLTKQDIRVLKPKLMELSNAGIEFRITERPQERIPKVNWPIKPSFGTADGGQLVTAVSFIWDNNAFVCPACGETFVFRRVGKPKPTPAPMEAAAAPAVAPAAAPPAKPAAAPAPAAKPAPAPAKPAAAPAKPAPAPAKPAAKKPVEEEDLGTVDLLDEVPTLDLDDVKPLDDIAPLDDVRPRDEIEEVEEVPAKPAAKGPAPKGPAPKGPPPKGPVKPGGMIKPSVDLDEVEVAGGEDELASVFLNRIPSPKDQDTAAKIIAEVRSCPMKEAKELAARMVIPVVKDIPMKEAEEILAKFQKAKIAGRITKKK
ncbi:MAG: hypothetical protein IT452_09655 [Planctomycetia bacterium]|nr:hypothetical protein [Planctomycetia bacterium]